MNSPRPKTKATRKSITCEGCKARKIKCDRTKVCSTCVARRIPCVWIRGAPSRTSDEAELDRAQQEITRLRSKISSLTRRLRQLEGEKTTAGISSTLGTSVDIFYSDGDGSSSCDDPIATADEAIPNFTPYRDLLPNDTDITSPTFPTFPFFPTYPTFPTFPGTFPTLAVADPNSLTLSMESIVEYCDRNVAGDPMRVLQWVNQAGGEHNAAPLQVWNFTCGF